MGGSHWPERAAIAADFLKNNSGYWLELPPFRQETLKIGGTLRCPPTAFSPRPSRLARVTSSSVHVPTRFLPLWIAAASALPSAAPSPAASAFVDVSRERGISFTNVNGASGKKYLVETMLGGAAWLDYDGDGFFDLYLVQGHRHPETALDGPGGPDEPRNVLYKNVAGKRFEDVTDPAGVGDRGYGMGVAVGDYDRDGRPDLYVTNYGENVLYRNRGDGTFEDATPRSGVAGGGWSTSALWADLDGDGLLDLFVATYLAYDTHKDGACFATPPGGGEKLASYCHPHHFEGVPDVVYRNLGDGTFKDMSRESGISRSKGWLEGKGLGAVASDFDADGDLDIFVANDSVPHSLWRNLGGFRFEDAALETGFAFNAEGAPQAGMGIARGDVDGDGLEDVYVTTFSRETDTLYVNQGGRFLDLTIERGVARPTYLPLAFGVRFLDHDLDGDLDVYVANGHILDNAERLNPGEGILYAQPDLLLENNGAGFFRDISKNSGAWFQRALVGRGVAEADYDNDGDPDLLVTNVTGPAVLLENRAGGGKPWIGFDLRPGRGPGPAGGVVQGTRIELAAGKAGKAGESKRVRVAGTDGSYLSAHDPRVRFGLPEGGSRVTARVWWPGAKEPQTLEGLEAGRYHVLERPGK